MKCLIASSIFMLLEMNLAHNVQLDDLTADGHLPNAQLQYLNDEVKIMPQFTYPLNVAPPASGPVKYIKNKPIYPKDQLLPRSGILGGVGDGIGGIFGGLIGAGLGAGLGAGVGGGLGASIGTGVLGSGPQPAFRPSDGQLPSYMLPPGPPAPPPPQIINVQPQPPVMGGGLVYPGYINGYYPQGYIAGI